MCSHNITVRNELGQIWGSESKGILQITKFDFMAMSEYIIIVRNKGDIYMTRMSKAINEYDFTVGYQRPTVQKLNYV